MKKRQQGVLTVEASIVLTLCILFVLFLFSFARVYSAQSLVSHAVLQSSDAVALESYLREATLNGSEADVTELANRLTGTTSITADSYKSLRAADLPKIAKEKFVYAIDSDKEKADQKLKRLGVKDGLDGIDFSASKIDLGNDDVVVYATYTVKMQFSIFGMDEITVTKAAKSKTFGDILFDIEVIPENPIMGTASGGGSYKYGTEIEISATPSYGYKFVKWADGNTENPRKVTVADAKTYVAIFEASEFGVNLVSKPEEGGKTTGEGIYKYLSDATITATALPGYSFKSWSIYEHVDNETVTINSPTTTIKIDQSYTCTANFKKNSYTVKVKNSGQSSGKAYIVYQNKNNSSITAEYQTGFKLVAPSVSGYRFLGWKEEGSNSYFSTNANLSMKIPAKNVTYVACYESLVRTVNFFDYNGNLYATRQVSSGSSLGSNMPPNPKKQGQIFNGWQNFSASTIVRENRNVYSNWYKCNSHVAGDCGVVHTIAANKLSFHSSPGKTYQCMCIVCAYCGDYLTWKNGRYQTANAYKWSAGNGGYIWISPSVWCIKHTNPYGDCSSYKNRTSAGTYYVH